jgi:LAS superfamily LD-carboxypeptidase LdcB
MVSTAFPYFAPVICVGREMPPLVLLEPGGPYSCHVAAWPVWQALVAAAASAGMELAAVSAYRSFATQEAIWNAKWRGERPVLNRAGESVEMARLNDADRVAAILAWSALPGASRHHWGTEFDVIDRAALPKGYVVQLVPAEYAPGGPFAKLGRWLDDNLEGLGFHRPYRRDLGGVAPEPWHLSCTAVAGEASRRLRLAHLHEAVASSSMEGRAAVLAELPALYERYVRRVDRPPPLRKRPTK